MQRPSRPRITKKTSEPPKIDTAPRSNNEPCESEEPLTEKTRPRILCANVQMHTSTPRFGDQTYTRIYIITSMKHITKWRIAIRKGCLLHVPLRVRVGALALPEQLQDLSQPLLLRFPLHGCCGRLRGRLLARCSPGWGFWNATPGPGDRAIDTNDTDTDDTPPPSQPLPSVPFRFSLFYSVVYHSSFYYSWR